MKTIKISFLLASTVALTACGGGASCNSTDVKQSLLGLIAGNTSGTENAVEGMFGVGTTSPSMDAFLSGTISGVTTLSKSDDIGHHLCKADIAVELPDGKIVSQEMTYQVMKVESGEADFEVSADQSDINRLRWAVNGPINQELRKQAEEKKKNDAIAAFKANPPIAVPDGEAVAKIKVVLGEMAGSFDESQFKLFPVDLNSDGYKEYIALWRDTSSSRHIWKTKVFSQDAANPGQQATLQYSLEDYYPFYRDHPISYELNGNVLTVSDGTGWTESKEFNGSPISRALYQ